MNIKKLLLLILFLLFSNAVWSDTFELVCDIKIEPMTQGRYQFDTDSKTVSEIGLYSGENYSEKISHVYETIGWNLEEDMLIWVSNHVDDTKRILPKPEIKTFDIIVFDLRNMHITFSRSARKGDLIEHIFDFTESCIRD